MSRLMWTVLPPLSLITTSLCPTSVWCVFELFCRAMMMWLFQIWQWPSSASDLCIYMLAAVFSACVVTFVLQKDVAFGDWTGCNIKTIVILKIVWLVLFFPMMLCLISEQNVLLVLETQKGHDWTFHENLLQCEMLYHGCWSYSLVLSVIYNGLDWDWKSTKGYVSRIKWICDGKALSDSSHSRLGPVIHSVLYWTWYLYM